MSAAADQNFARVDDVSLRLRFIEGDTFKPTIVFLHDSLGCIKTWRKFPDKLCKATGCPGLIYDRQGYGESDPFSGVERHTDYLELEADVLAELLRVLSIPKSVLFGHSDGGSIALIAAAKTPDLIAAVITEGAHIFVEQITLDGIKQGRQLYSSTDLRARLWRYHNEKTDSVFSAWADTWLSPRFISFNIEHFLASIKCPVMAIQGVKDEFGTEAQVDGIINQVGGRTRKFMVPSAGHTPHKEDATSTLNASVSFLKEVVDTQT